MYTHLPPAERWFLDHGLPAFSTHRSTWPQLIARIAPLAVFALAAQIAALASTAIMAALLRSPTLERLNQRGLGDRADAEQVVDDLLALATLVVPAIGLASAVVVAWLVARCSERIRQWLGGSALLIFVIGPLGARLGIDFSGILSSSPTRLALWFIIRLVAVLLALLLVRWGVGSVLSAGWRYARSEISPMIPVAAKALPLTVLSFLFAFFSAETWQVSAAVSLQRLTAVVFTLIGLSVALLARTLHERVEGIVEQGFTREAFDGFVRTGEIPALAVTGSRRRTLQRANIHVAVTRREQINLTALQVMTHTWQALVFGGVVFVFLLGFCVLAIPHAVEQKWTDLAPAYLSVNEVILPVTLTYIKVSALLAGVSVLSFAGAYATDKQEGRAEREVHQALCVKYGASRRRA